jgi:tripartite-type tricarboxylate transporter receptor subunit TctC
MIRSIARCRLNIDRSRRQNGDVADHGRDGDAGPDRAGLGFQRRDGSIIIVVFDLRRHLRRRADSACAAKNVSARGEWHNQRLACRCSGTRGIAMNLSRRQLMYLAATAVGLPATARIATAIEYPSRPVRIVIGYAAGGPTDTTARLLAQWLSQRSGKQFLVENLPGAGGNTATEAVVSAAPDGYTLLGAVSSATINTALYQSLRFVFHRDTAPVAAFASAPNVLEVTPSFPANSVPEFVAYAKANPGRINFASGGNGTSQHVSGELFKMMTGVDMVHVPYRGVVHAHTDLMAGRIQVMFDSVPSSLGFVRAGQTRGLAVTSATRSAVLPELPTIAEFVPGFEVTGWFGICAPSDTPSAIVTFLNREINAAMVDPIIKGRLADLGLMPMPGSPAEFGEFIMRETEKWARVVKFAGIKAE